MKRKTMFIKAKEQLFPSSAEPDQAMLADSAKNIQTLKAELRVTFIFLPGIKTITSQSVAVMEPPHPPPSTPQTLTFSLASI